MKHLSYLIATFFIYGCLPSKSTDGGGVKPRDCGTDFIGADSKTDNELTLANINKPIYGVEISYKNTRPSSLSWKIVDGKVVVGEEKKYSLEYSDGSNTWNLFDELGTMAGSLTPFKTANCERVQRLSLSLFMKEEEADAFLSYSIE